MAFTLFQWLVMFVLLPQAKPQSTAENSLNQRLKTEVLHPFFISVTEINHNVKDKALEISCKIFADDMEETLKKNYKTSIDISNEKQQLQIHKLLADYLQKHLQITADNNPLNLKLIGYEKENESIFCYLEATNIVSVKKMNITNSILHDFTPQQINIIHVIVDGKRQSIKLDFPNKEAILSF